MIARFGESVKPGQNYRLRPGAYAVLIRDGRVLVTHQEAPLPEFQLPGGGIDPGEGAIDALHREVREETGWAITGLRRLGAYRRFTYMPEYEFWAEKLCSIWTARPVLRRGAPSEPGHSAHWMAPGEALDALANEGDRHFLWQALRTL
ncbi:NUDIX domain-containing protein [Thioclava atlantica]|uniref:NUDIX superfamily hydrolase n=1 Tax=Thioclava atlantica TaxID=1317124 RepID=A0A085TWH9_9RHOB|nr:NUDIX hydrolase [Thioclava atlantica]KFE35076.1 NUDIX superfamily hydrolase [Thioclava atlantica]